MGELELACYLCRAPVGTTDEGLPDPVAGPRRATEECFQTAWTESGLENYQVRRYDAYGTSRWPCWPTPAWLSRRRCVAHPVELGMPAG